MIRGIVRNTYYSDYNQFLDMLSNYKLGSIIRPGHNGFGRNISFYDRAIAEGYLLAKLVVDDIVDNIFGIYVVIKRPVREVSEDIIDEYYN